MSLPHMSIPTVDGIEFINLQSTDISPLVSKCEIKVFYLGKNRNGSFISKQTAKEMATTLRGCPIVGYYNEEKEDFRDHGEKITIDGDGVHFECETKPYGFVAPDSKVWFKDFEETGDFGNKIIRTYLMTEGYLWTGQFKEAAQILEDDGKPHSMELDDKTLDGHWTIDDNTGIDFFIINSAVISKLCVLGDDIEPCFEGSSVTEPKVSKDFTLDKDFKCTLFSMMEDLKSIYKEGENMAEEKKEFTAAEEQGNSVEESAVENQSNTENQNPAAATEEFASNDDKKEENDQPSENNDSTGTEDKKQDDDEKKPAAKNSLHTDEEYAELESKFTELQNKFNAMSEDMNKLVEFKNQAEDKEKDALIAQFYMLSNEDKKDVIEHKREYSLEDIEAKLAVIGCHKGVNFGLDTSSEKQDDIVVNMDNNSIDSTPDWVNAVMSVENNM